MRPFRITTMLLAGMASLAAGPPVTTLDPIAIAVADIDAVLGWPKGHDVPWCDFAGRPGVVDASRTGHVRQTFVQDPDGYGIEINDSRAAAR